MRSSSDRALARSSLWRGLRRIVRLCGARFGLLFAALYVVPELRAFACLTLLAMPLS